jgi:hypothetical protein
MSRPTQRQCDWHVSEPSLTLPHSVDRSFVNNPTTSSSKLRSRSLSPSIVLEPSHNIPQRTLRRKKCMTTLRLSNPAPQCHSQTNLSSTTHSTPELPNFPSVPLGHPSRPYYSAIRKNMSRPNSPFDNTNSKSSCSLAPLPLLHSSPLASSVESSDDLLTETTFTPPVMSSRLLSCEILGCSMSGETEMRIALSRQQVRGTPDNLMEYRFPDTHTSDMGRPASKGGVRGKVKKLSRDFMHLVVGLTVKVTALNFE